MNCKRWPDSSQTASCLPLRQESWASAAIPLRVWLLHDGELLSNILHSSSLCRLLQLLSKVINIMKTQFTQRLPVFQEIDPNKDYTIPRPQTTNFNQPYDEYYAQQWNIIAQKKKKAHKRNLQQSQRSWTLICVNVNMLFWWCKL